MFILVLSLCLAFASAGNIMDLITDESKGGSITEIEFDGCDQDDYDGKYQDFESGTSAAF